jgi:hypothetical protein
LFISNDDLPFESGLETRDDLIPGPKLFTRNEPRITAHRPPLVSSVPIIPDLNSSNRFPTVFQWFVLICNIAQLAALLLAIEPPAPRLPPAREDAINAISQAAKISSENSTFRVAFSAARPTLFAPMLPNSMSRVHILRDLDNMDES